MYAEFELNSDGSTSQKGSSWGGARRGAGRKPSDYQPSAAEIEHDKARARNELAKAQLNELQLKIKTGEYVSRAAMKQAAATLLSTVAQSMRGIPDNLERKGIPLEVCQRVESVIDETLNGLASDLEMLAGEPLDV